MKALTEYLTMNVPSRIVVNCSLAAARADEGEGVLGGRAGARDNRPPRTVPVVHRATSGSGDRGLATRARTAAKENANTFTGDPHRRLVRLSGAARPYQGIVLV
jgi:hypothetical protein